MARSDCIIMVRITNDPKPNLKTIATKIEGIFLKSE